MICKQAGGRAAEATRVWRSRPTSLAPHTVVHRAPWYHARAAGVPAAVRTAPAAVGRLQRNPAFSPLLTMRHMPMKDKLISWGSASRRQLWGALAPRADQLAFNTIIGGLARQAKAAQRQAELRSRQSGGSESATTMFALG